MNSNLAAFVASNLFILIPFIVIIEILYKRHIKSNSPVDVSQYSSNWGEIENEYRLKSIAEGKTSRKKAYILLAGFVFFLQTSIVPGYAFFAIISLVLTHMFYRSEFLKIDKHREGVRRRNLIPEPIFEQRLLSLKENTKAFAGFILVLSAFWLYQTETNLGKDRETFLNDIREFQTKKWCATSSYDFDEYGALIDTSWPCFRVDEILSVDFKSENFNDVVCVDLSLDLESGYVGQNQYVQYFNIVSGCTEYDDGYSVDSLYDVFDGKLSKDLQKRKVELCNRYYYGTFSEKYSIYCAN